MLFTRGNIKLHKNIVTFSLPAGRAGSCEKDCANCYAMRTERLRPIVARHRRANMAVSQNWAFVSLAIEELKEWTKRKVKYVRVHEGGDFYDMEYVMKWHHIATSLPKLTFYCYTKAEELDLEPLKELDNFIVMRSLEPLLGKPNYVGLKEWTEYKNRGYVVCRSHSEPQCGLTCDYCMRKENEHQCPVFLKH